VIEKIIQRMLEECLALPGKKSIYRFFNNSQEKCDKNRSSIKKVGEEMQIKMFYCQDFRTFVVLPLTC